MTSTPPDWHRIALALNNVATTLQQLAVEIDHAARATRVVIPEGQLPIEDLRQELAAGAFRTPEPVGLQRLYGTPEPASVAEPECGCSLYTRCDHHESTRAKGCSCNGPEYASTTCVVGAHRSKALALIGQGHFDRNPAQAD